MARESEEGFSLIELMVVVLIIAVLLGIAIPTFLGARSRANDRAVESNVRNAFTATRVYYNDKQRYSDDPAEMSGVEPTLQWTNTDLDGSQPQNAVYVEVQDVPDTAQTVVVVGRSKAGRCFYLRDIMGGATAGTHYIAKVPGGVKWAAITLLLVVLQVTLGIFGHETPYAGMLHGVNALALFTTAGYTARRAMLRGVGSTPSAGDRDTVAV